MVAMVEVVGISKSYGSIKAVDEISFSTDKGDVLGVLGPNGAGKSTAMKIITGFLNPDAGRVTIGGDDISEAPIAVKKRIGYLPEGAPLYADMTTSAFLDFIAQVRGFSGAEKQKRIDQAVERVNLDVVLDQPIETLSKGFKRRVGLGQAILHDPEVLILDEPTDGLDPNQKHEVRNLIQEMSSEKVIILSTHILEEVDAVCNRTLIIAEGKVVADGTPAELEARSSLHNTVTLTVNNGIVDLAIESISKVKGVVSVERHAQLGDDVRLRIFPGEGQSILADIHQVTQENSWQIKELYLERGRLEDVFRSITTSHGS